MAFRILGLVLLGLASFVVFLVLSTYGLGLMNSPSWFLVLAGLGAAVLGVGQFIAALLWAIRVLRNGNKRRNEWHE